MHARTRNDSVLTARRPVIATGMILAFLAAGCESNKSTDQAAQRQIQKAWGTTPTAHQAPTSDDIPEVKSPDILPDTHFAAGRLHESQRQYALALEQYRQAVKLTPNHIEAYNRMGVVLDQLGRLKEADETFLKALRLDPNQAHVRNNLAFSYILQTRWTDAEAALNEAIQQKPGFARARVNLGMVLAQQNRFDEALQQFAHALPKADAYYNLGLMYQSRHKLPEAARAYKTALEYNKNFVAAQKRLEKLPPEAVKTADSIQMPTPQPMAIASATPRATQKPAPVAPTMTPVTASPTTPVTPATEVKSSPSTGNAQSAGVVEVVEIEPATPAPPSTVAQAKTESTSVEQTNQFTAATQEPANVKATARTDGQPTAGAVSSSETPVAAGPASPTPAQAVTANASVSPDKQTTSSQARNTAGSTENTGLIIETIYPEDAPPAGSSQATGKTGSVNPGSSQSSTPKPAAQTRKPSTKKTARKAKPSAAAAKAAPLPQPLPQKTSAAASNEPEILVAEDVIESAPPSRSRASGQQKAAGAKAAVTTAPSQAERAAVTTAPAADEAEAASPAASPAPDAEAAAPSTAPAS